MGRRVRQWLEGLGLERYADAMAANDVDWRALVHLTDDDLKELGVSLGHRRIMLTAIEALERDGREDGAGGPPTLQAGRSASQEGERRQLSVMFCDLVGSTALSGRLDPEELREVLRRYQNIVVEAVRFYDGYVAKFLGDGVLAYFGWPQAHEDQAERAVRAGLRILSAIEAADGSRPLDMQVRIGIDTGPVVVGDLVGDELSDTEAVIGSTPNLAARLQGAAEPGQIVIGQVTRRLLGSAFEMTYLEPMALKGFADPVQGWVVHREVDAETRLLAAHRQRLTKRVGREHELGLLQERWRRAAAGDGQVVMLVGAAGIGKSRIVHELRREIGEDEGTSLSLQCSPHRTNSAFHPVIQYMRHAADFALDDDPATKLDKLEAFLDASGEDVAQVAPVFAAVMSLPGEERYGALDLSPQLFRGEVIRLSVDHIIGQSRKHGMLCVVEDAHWIDPSMTELVGELIARVQGEAVCVLVTSRPEYRRPWPDHAHLSTINLARLSRPQAAEIVRAIAGPALLPAIVDQIVDRSDGVPLYVEELTRAVLEDVSAATDGAADRLVPASLQASLVARLDRLGEAKEVAQVGAVIGREFTEAGVCAVLGCAPAEIATELAQLEKADLVVRRGRPPSVTYTFKHALVQDAAYGTILKARRRTIHARILADLESQLGQQVEERVEMLGHHAHRGQVWDKAFQYLVAAGKRAMQRSALHEAASHFERALDASENVPQTPDLLRETIAVRYELRNVMWGLARFDDILTTLAAAEEDAAQLDDPLNAGWISVFRSASLWQLGRADEAVRASEDALAVGEAHGDLSLSVAANFYLGCAHVTAGAHGLAETHFGNVVDMLPGEKARLRCGLPFAPAVIALSWLVWAYAEDGRFADGARSADEALDIAKGIGQPFNIAHIYYDLGYFHQIQGDLDSAISVLERSYDMVNEWGFTYLSPFIMGFLGHARAVAGRVQEGLLLLQQAQVAYHKVGLGLFRALVSAQLGEAQFLAGDPGLAATTTTQALSLARSRGERGFEAHALRILGDISASRQVGDHAQASAHYNEALTLTEALGMRPLEARLHRALARLAERTGDEKAAARHAARAAAIAEEIGMAFWPERDN